MYNFWKSELDKLPILPKSVWLRITDSHDVHGGNDDGFTSTYSYLYATEEGMVLFDYKDGPGCVKLIRTIGYTRVLKVYIDDEEDARIIIPFVEMYSGTHPDFPGFLACDESRGHGSAWSFVPIPFTKSCKIVATDNIESYHFFNIWVHIYSECNKDTRVDGNTHVETLAGTLEAPPFANSLVTVKNGSGVMKALLLKLPEEKKAEALKSLRIRAWWDDNLLPCVDAPIGLFFGAGYSSFEPSDTISFYSVDGVGDIALGRVATSAIPVGEMDNGYYYCYFPMPFWNRARIQLVNYSPIKFNGIEYKINIAENHYPFHTGYFHALYHREDGTVQDRDYTVSQVRGIGKYVGCVVRMSSRGLDKRLKTVQRMYLEGDARFYIDDSKAFLCGGTGTEEYFNWGWYDVSGKDQVFTFPTHGYVEHVRDIEDHTTMYRFHIIDYIPYYRSFKFMLEHGPEGRNIADYSSVSFHYHRDESALVLLGQLDIGNVESETLYGYRTSNIVWEGKKALIYEGNDQVIDKYLSKSTGENWYDIAGISDTGRVWKGSCQYVIPIPQINNGLKIRRRYDGEWPHDEELYRNNRTRVVSGQEVTVYVDGEKAGIWYLPPHHARKCWMEDEFEVAAKFTKGKDRITVVLQNQSECGWNEYKYWFFAYKE